MGDVDCRYFRETSVGEAALAATECAHPRYHRQTPDCDSCIVPLIARQKLCPGISQRLDAARQQFRYRCTIHRVKVDNPFSSCRSLRTCPLDCEQAADIPSQPLRIVQGSVAEAFLRRLNEGNHGDKQAAG